MKILIPVIMYGRHEVFKAFAQGVINLQEAFPEHNIECLVVGTGDEEAVKPYMKDHNFWYINYDNMPLSEKAQYRLDVASTYKPDYLLFLGSDDIIDVETFRYYLEKIEEGHDWIAPYDICYYDNGDIYYSEGYKIDSPRYMESLAVGRCISSELLDKCNWELWMEQRDKNIDRQAYEKLSLHATNPHFFHLKDTGGCIYDIKTEDSLSQFDPKKFQKIGEDNEYMAENILPHLNTHRQRIHPTAVIYPNVTLGNNVTIEAGAVIGVPGAIRDATSFDGEVFIHDNVKIGAGVIIARGEKGNTIIGENCLIMNKALIGHNSIIGDNCEIGAGVLICGHVTILENCRIKAGGNVRNRILIRRGITVGMGSNVIEDLTTEGCTYVGNPCNTILKHESDSEHSHQGDKAEATA